MSKIIPSILEKTEAAFAARVRAIESVTDTAQLDVLDHTFLPYRTFHDPAFVDSLNTSLKIEVHLMTNATPETVQVWNKPWVRKIIVHLKAVEDPRLLAGAISALGKLPGLALDPEASLLEAKQYLNDFETVVIMGVHPGRSGQPIVPATMEKIKRLRAIAPEVVIEFDGGVNAENIAYIGRSGADLIVVGSALPIETFAEAYSQLTSLIHATEANKG